MRYHETSRITLIAAAPIARASLVRLDADGLRPCDADASPVGFAELGATAAGDQVSVRLMNATGTFACRAAGSITPGALLMPAADGTVAAHSGNAPIVGQALTAAGQGELVSVVPLFSAAPAGAGA